MIISRTPLRMSFVGGGSDLPAFYRLQPGAVLSTSIDKYVYVTVNAKFDERLRISYSRTEEAGSVGKVKHPLVREALRKLGIEGGLEITSIADIPSRGTGLGSSSSFTVGLLHALHAYQGRYCSAEQLAEETCEIEIERCGEPIGKQDQYAAAYGGLSFIQFFPDESVSVEPVLCRRETVRSLEENILMFYTGITRKASSILKAEQEQIGSNKGKQKILMRMVDLARQLKHELEKNNLDAFGQIIHENWLLKKSIADHVSSDRIDNWYQAARGAGALGGKLLGAGSGGFLMFYAAREKHQSITRALQDLRRIQVGFEPLGSRIIFVH